MQKLNKSHIISLIIFLISILPFIFYGASLIAFILPLVVLTLVLLYGASVISSNFYIEAICKVQTDKKQIAITFDDGPDKINTIKVLNILDEYKVHATFFCIGRKIEANKDLINEIDKRGSLIGNHTYLHSNGYNFLTKSKTVEDLLKTENQIYDIIKKKPLYFRPPNGVTNITLRKAVDELKYKVIGWSVRPFDTVIKDKNKIIKKLKAGLVPGAIVLLHDINDNIDIILRAYLEFVKENRYEVVPLDKLTGEKAYE